MRFACLGTWVALLGIVAWAQSDADALLDRARELTRARQWQQAYECYCRAAAIEGLPPRKMVDVEGGIAHMLMRQKKWKECIPHWYAALAACPDAPPHLHEYALRQMLTAVEVVDSERAYLEIARRLHDLAARPDMQDPSMQAKLLVGQGECLRKIGHMNKAGQMFTKATEMDTEPVVKARAHLCLGLAFAHYRRWDPVCENLVAAIDHADWFLNGGTGNAYFLELAHHCCEERGARRVAACLHPAILRHVDNPQLCGVVYDALTAGMIADSRWREACFFARIWVETALEKTEGEAIERLETALRAADRNSRRVKAWQRYREFLAPGPDGKPGTGDDLKNPLLDIDAPRDERFNAAFEEALEQPDRASWEGRLQRALVYRHWGRPREELAELDTAYALGATDPAARERLNVETANTLLRLTGDPGIGDRLTAFRRHGRSGPDGNPGTPDDLTDPIAPYR